MNQQKITRTVTQLWGLLFPKIYQYVNMAVKSNELQQIKQVYGNLIQAFENNIQMDDDIALDKLGQTAKNKQNTKLLGLAIQITQQIYDLRVISNNAGQLVHINRVFKIPFLALGLQYGSDKKMDQFLAKMEKEAAQIKDQQTDKIKDFTKRFQQQFEILAKQNATTQKTESFQSARVRALSSRLYNLRKVNAGNVVIQRIMNKVVKIRQQIERQDQNSSKLEVIDTIMKTAFMKSDQKVIPGRRFSGLKQFQIRLFQKYNNKVKKYKDQIQNEKQKQKQMEDEAQKQKQMEDEAQKQKQMEGQMQNEDQIQENKNESQKIDQEQNSDNEIRVQQKPVNKNDGVFERIFDFKEKGNNFKYQKNKGQELSIGKIDGGGLTTFKDNSKQIKMGQMAREYYSQSCVNVVKSCQTINQNATRMNFILACWNEVQKQLQQKQKFFGNIEDIKQTAKKFVNQMNENMAEQMRKYDINLFDFQAMIDQKFIRRTSWKQSIKNIKNQVEQTFRKDTTKSFKQVLLSNEDISSKCKSICIFGTKNIMKRFQHLVNYYKTSQQKMPQYQIDNFVNEIVRDVKQNQQLYNVVPTMGQNQLQIPQQCNQHMANMDNSVRVGIQTIVNQYAQDYLFDEIGSSLLRKSERVNNFSATAYTNLGTFFKQNQKQFLELQRKQNQNKLNQDQWCDFKSYLISQTELIQKSVETLIRSSQSNGGFQYYQQFQDTLESIKSIRNIVFNLDISNKNEFDPRIFDDKTYNVQYESNDKQNRGLLKIIQQNAEQMKLTKNYIGDSLNKNKQVKYGLQDQIREVEQQTEAVIELQSRDQSQVVEAQRHRIQELELLNLRLTEMNFKETIQRYLQLTNQPDIYN